MSATRRRTVDGATTLSYNTRAAFGLVEPSPLPPDTTVLRYRNIGPVISNPIHGDTGWTTSGDRVIFANGFVCVPPGYDGRLQAVHPREGWYPDTDYRILKVVCTGRLDWRVELPDQEVLRASARLAREAEERRRSLEWWTPPHERY